MQNKVQLLFRMKEAAVWSSTQSLWYKKYELEVLERAKVERRLEAISEANRHLSRASVYSRQESLQGSLCKENEPVYQEKNESSLVDKSGRSIIFTAN